MLYFTQQEQTGTISVGTSLTDAVQVSLLEGCKYLSIDIANSSSGQPLASFYSYAKGANGAEFHAFGTGAADYTTGLQQPLLTSSGDPTTMGTGTSVLLSIENQGHYEYKFAAASGTSGAGVASLTFRMKQAHK